MALGDAPSYVPTQSKRDRYTACFVDDFFHMNLERSHLFHHFLGEPMGEQMGTHTIAKPKSLTAAFVNSVVNGGAISCQRAAQNPASSSVIGAPADALPM
ncbi:hypothetical protein EU800_26025 [Tropicimonas sp. IMCC6043]|nr:hypothetical protein EU800_26025 [Tropicimonas sp. IMCC6043]